MLLFVVVAGLDCCCRLFVAVCYLLVLLGCWCCCWADGVVVGCWLLVGGCWLMSVGRCVLFAVVLVLLLCVAVCLLFVGLVCCCRRLSLSFVVYYCSLVDVVN